MKSCENCGTRLSSGICPNCEEESYIFAEQYHEDPFPLSEDFLSKARSQEMIIKERREAAGPETREGGGA